MSEESYPLSSHEGQLVALPDFSKLAACWKFTDEYARTPEDDPPGPGTYYFRMRAGSGYLQGYTSRPVGEQEGGTEWGYIVTHSGSVPVGPLHDVGAALYKDLPTSDQNCKALPGSKTANTNVFYVPPLGSIALDWDSLRGAWVYVARSWAPGGVEEVTLSPSGVVGYRYMSGTGDMWNDSETPDGRARDHNGLVMVGWFAPFNPYMHVPGWGPSQYTPREQYYPAAVIMGYGGGIELRRVKPRDGGRVRIFDKFADLQVSPNSGGPRYVYAFTTLGLCGGNSVLGTLSFDISEEPWE